MDDVRSVPTVTCAAARRVVEAALPAAAGEPVDVCVAVGLATHDWYDLIAQEPALLHGIVHTERLVIFGGGVALCVDGQRIGAVGVSGGSAEQDRRVAEAAAAVLELEPVR